jgi:predicted DCC family thiol-disulfide oxidoreductase YuxK
VSAYTSDWREFPLRSTFEFDSLGVSKTGDLPSVASSLFAHSALRYPIMTRRSANTPSRGCVLYDDACGFCRRWVPFWAATLRLRGYEIAPLQSEWVRQHFNATDGTFFHDLRLLLADGTQLQGADVYRHVMRRIWWAYPCFLLSCAPILRNLFDLAYRTVADNRFRISTVCRLPNPPGVQSSDAEVDIPHR